MIGPGHLTAIDFDALALGEIPAEERALIEAHAHSCPACARLQREHHESVRRFRAEVFDRTMPAVRGRLAGRRRTVATLAAVSAAAALVLVFRTAGPRLGSERGPSTALAVKGPGSLQVFARRGQRVFPVGEGTVLAPGDAIRFFVEPSANDHVIIGSVDGAGKISIYYPYDGTHSAALAPGQRLEVPGSIVLDRVPGPERIFAVFSRRPLPSERVREALATVGAGGEVAIRKARVLSLPGSSQASLQFEKRESAP